MPLNTQLADATVNAQAAALAALCNSGIIRIYDGIQPANADTAIATQTLGVSLALNAIAFGAPDSGLIAANPISSGVAVAGITPTWARVLRSDGVTSVMDMAVGAGSNIQLGAFTTGTIVTCTSFTHDVRNSTVNL